MNTAENQAFWDGRAALGETAGTQDLILKQLEQRAILAAIPSTTGRILEIGCGRGETARLVASLYPQSYVRAIDSSIKMIAEARQEPSDVTFSLGDALFPPPIPFHVVYTQRCLINMTTWDDQRQVIDAIAERLVPGGLFLMCEHSQDGLDAINERRTAWGRPAIERPWHTRYFKDVELATVTSLRFVRCVPFSATYYFLSRVLNDKLAADSQLVPSYEAPINKLALDLTADCVDSKFAQGRLWIWEKA